MMETRWNFRRVFFLPEDAYANPWAHFETFGVLEVWEEGLYEMTFLGRDDNHARLVAKPDQGFQFFKLRPVADFVFYRSQVEGEWPGVLRRQGNGGERIDGG